MLISIIIPTLNNVEPITATLAHLAEQPGDREVIVTVGGSAAQPLDPRPGPARVVALPGAVGGTLLNAAAAAAKGEVLLFLWPDSRLPPNALAAIEQNLQLLPQTIGGNFHLKFDKDTLFTRWLAHWLKRQRYRGHYDGHSGIFIRREVFRALDGFRPYDILADYDLARRMEAYGPTVYLPEAITTPTRKFRGRHILQTILVGLFRLGVHPNRLARLSRLITLTLPT